MKILSRAIVLIFLFLCNNSYAQDLVQNENSTVKLSIIEKKDANLFYSIEFDLKEGWHIYWKNPGDSGMAPKFDSTKSNNIADMQNEWPIPERMLDKQTGIETYIYQNKVVIPFSALIIDNPAKLSMEIEYAICNKICLLEKASLFVDLPMGDFSIPNADQIKMENARLVPYQGHTASIISAKYNKISANKTLFIIEKQKDEQKKYIELFINDPQKNSFAKPLITNLKDRAIFEVEVEGSWKGEPLGLIFVDEEGRGVEIGVPFTQDASLGGEISIMLLILFALIGGLILNIMPCVLPVLSIKLLAIIKYGHKSKMEIRASLLTIAAGIITAFVALALIVIMLKSLGHQIGWGFQFQSAYFITIMAFITLFFGVNMLGRFEIALPSSINSKMAASGGNFLTGIFATILATPCSAPFLGTAITFAFSRSNNDIIWIFLLVGIGMAMPYLLLAIIPNWLSRLPKPGAWTEKFKKFLGLLMIATSIWLVYVYSGVAGIQAAIYLFAIGGIIKYILEHRKINRLIFKILLILPFITISFYLPKLFVNPTHHKIIAKNWHQFDENIIAEKISAGQVVLVDVTADWCVTCQANKLLVLDRKEIQEFFQENNIYQMQADITIPDDNILLYMKKHGRHAIPFNIIYGPNAPEGIILSELLSKGEVIEAVKKASHQ